ncbi:hypothetical protein EW146_g1122 [Bondarzewia mesenterica]|uniref:Diphthamide biosynthesis protein 4 n=1 Tax=Bondarzewia mesenterica TaxID=1095465 RepID=A0A4S4M4X8_9AGAM|nr:hypothetical protein EW146_g1122 [Bondarzewia mesenterica]
MSPEVKVLASPPGDCCVKTVQHSGNTVGTLVDIGGVNTYVSFPPMNEDQYPCILMYFSDIFSPLYINNKLTMDFYASKGYLVLGPDYFEGDSIANYLEGETGFSLRSGFDLEGWVSTKREKANELVPKFVEAVRAKYGRETTKYAAVGAIAHPTDLDEDHFRKAKKPIFLSCAEIDWSFPPAARHKAEELLAASSLKPEYHFQLFGHVEHGFAVRGDVSVPRIRWAKEESARGIIGWFDRFCKIICLCSAALKLFTYKSSWADNNLSRLVDLHSFVADKLDTPVLLVDEPDYYTLLSIPPTASPADIKAAYHHALLILHPDRNKKALLLSSPISPTNSSSTAIDIGRIKDAYQTLSTPKLRVEYDAALHLSRNGEGKGGPRPAQVISLEDFAEDEGMGVWSHPCRCGGVYRIGEQEMESGQHLIGCGSCSEVVWAGYEIIECDDGNG